MRSNSPVFRLGTAAAIVVSVLFSGTPAAAQGFLESLLGVFAPKPQRQQVAPRQRQAVPGSGEVRANPFDGQQRRWSSAGGGRYKTMCVRLCDGFYFPISNSAPRRDFYRDAEMCQSQCDSETRLFFMSKNGGSIEQAQDQSGLNYKELPNAFVYRKKLDQSCTCRAKPWSEAERNRHKRYAMIEAGHLDPNVAMAEAEAKDGDESAATEGGEEQAVETGVAKAQSSPRRPIVTVRRPVVAPRRPIKQPTYGLGALFSGGGAASSTKMQRFKKKFHWPSADGS